MKHVLVTVQRQGKSAKTFRVSATNAGEWKSLARPNGPVRNWQEESLASDAANAVDFSALPVNKLTDELPRVTVSL